MDAAHNTKTVRLGMDCHLAPVPSPEAPPPPGESRREMFRRWEGSKPGARPNGVPTGSAEQRRTVERS